MANTAQCYYCFETLYASYEEREPPSLTVVEDLWLQYEQFKEISALKLDRNEEGDPDNSSEPRALRPQGVTRLQSETSINSSSSAATPSSASTNSANSLLSTSTTATTPSTQSGHEKSSGQRYPLFVTWNTVNRSGHKSLRGCIGTFEAQDLADGLKSYALTSAFDDTRFSPIPKSLLPSLSCSLTLLGSFEPCTDAMDWSLGVHGLRISFIHRGRRFGATYLPDVAVEQGWTKEETVESLMRKAGWDGGSGGVTRRLLRAGASGSNSATDKPWDQVSDFHTVRYQGLKASAGYGKWQEWRKWVLSLDQSQKILN